MSARRRPSDDGQATVEFALLLPMLMLVLVTGMHLALLARNQVLVVHAARSAARVAASTADLGAIETAGRESVPVLDSARITVAVTGERQWGRPVRVRIRYRQPVQVPGIEQLLPDGVELTAEVAMPIEIP